jgi:hypothetical protein
LLSLKFGSAWSGTMRSLTPNTVRTINKRTHPTNHPFGGMNIEF